MGPDADVYTPRVGNLEPRLSADGIISVTEGDEKGGRGIVRRIIRGNPA